MLFNIDQFSVVYCLCDRGRQEEEDEEEGESRKQFTLPSGAVRRHFLFLGRGAIFNICNPLSPSCWPSLRTDR